MTSKQRKAKQRKSTKTGVKARGKHWAATSVDMHVASELLTAIADAVLQKADCDKGDFDVRPVYYADKPAAAATAPASAAGVTNGIHEHHDPTGGRRNESRLMVTITVTFYPDDRGSCDFMFTENRNQKHMDGIEGFRETCRLKQGAVAYFDGVINHRGRHSTGKTTGAQERLVLVIRAAVNTSYAEAEKSFRV